MRIAMAAILCASGVFADGMAFKGRDWHALVQAMENEQIAFIHHRDGVQQMLLSVDLEMADEEHGVWIFPVPGCATTTEIDVAGEFPRLRGRDPRKEVGQSLSLAMTAVRAFTILPLLVEGGCLLPTLSRAGSAGLMVHAEVEKLGLHVGLVSAASVKDLQSYVATRSAALDAAALGSLAPYLDGNYVFVVTWIISREAVSAAAPNGLRAVGGRKPCIQVRFETPEPFFPMRATSGYGDANIPVRLFLVGDHAPVADGYERDLRVEHYRQSRADWLSSFVKSGLLPDGEFPYTVVFGAVRAKELTSDLKFESVQPRGMAYARMVDAVTGGGSPVFVLLLVGMLSWISGGIAGLRLFGRWREPATLGLCNLLSLAGLIVALRNTDLSRWGRQPPTDGDRRLHEHVVRREFAIYFVFAFVALTIILQTALSIPLYFA